MKALSANPNIEGSINFSDANNMEDIIIIR